MQNLITKAYEIAASFDVTTSSGAAVVYSVSYMPDNRNKEAAFSYIKSHPVAQMLDNTPCGQALIALGLDGRVDEVAEEVTKIWKLASSRFIKAASGNINAFVEDADERSTFCSTELAEILKNPNITHINGQDKNEFAKHFKPKRY